MKDVPPDIAAAGPEAVRHYVKLLRQGYGHRWAEMCALQQPPGVKGTDRTLMQGLYNSGQFDGMPKQHAENILTLAKRAGISTSGKYYASGLADHRGPADPCAWVDSVSDVRKVAAARNLTVQGVVEQAGIPVPKAKSKALSERLTRELMREERARHPTMKKGELREYVIDRYGRKPKD